MAAKKPTKPKKFRQARSAAKADAKKAFSGKPQARLKDPTSKLELVDKEALKEVSKEAKGNFITDDKGNRIETKPVETAKERIAREKRVAMDKFRARVAAEDGVSEKPVTKKKAATKKAATPKAESKKKPTVKKPATTSTAVDKTLKTPEGKARYEKLIKEGVKPKSALNKALFYESKLPSQRAAAAPDAEAKSKTKKPKGTKVKGFKSITDASLTAMEDEKLKQTQAKLIKEGKLSGSKELAIRPKGEIVKPGAKVPATTTATVRPIPGSDTVVKKGGKLKKFAKGGLLLGLVMEVAQLGQSVKDQDRKNELERKIAALKGKTPDSKWKDMVQSLGVSGENIVNSVTMGIVGKRGGTKADELQVKYDKELAAKRARDNKNLRYGPDGSSLVPGTDAWKKGSKTRPTNPVAPGAAGGSSGGSSGGASGGSSGGSKGGSGSKGGTAPKVTPGSAYIVKSGDTLSAIAKAAGVSLSDIYATNKKFKQNPKYKGGNMIWSGTKVNIPTKK